MAQKRMFDLAIVQSDKFLDMSPTAQLLYFHLGMSADDDGFVPPRKVMRLLGTPVDDLRILIAKEFVIPFEDGVVVIKDWRNNNLIRSDRYKPTIYKEHLKKLDLSDSNSYILLGIPTGYQLDTNGKPSIEENRIEQNRVEGTTTAIVIPNFGEQEKDQLPPTMLKKFKEKYLANENDILAKWIKFIEHWKSKPRGTANPYPQFESWLMQDFRLRPKPQEKYWEKGGKK